MGFLCDFAQKTDELWGKLWDYVGLCEKCVIREFVRHMGILVDTLVEIALHTSEHMTIEISHFSLLTFFTFYGILYV